MTEDYLRPAMSIEIYSPLSLHLSALLLGMLMPSIGQADAKNVSTSPVAVAVNPVAAPVKPKESSMWMNVRERRFAVTLADTDAARGFAARLPLTLDMSELNGNEKKFDLPTALPANASRPGTIRNGDLMLYGTNTVVVFYMTFESAYSYTRLGRVDDPDGLAQALGARSIRVTFSRQ
jgi:hypothetical protein